MSRAAYWGLLLIGVGLANLGIAEFYMRYLGGFLTGVAIGGYFFSRRAESVNTKATGGH